CRNRAHGFGGVPGASGRADGQRARGHGPTPCSADCHGIFACLSGGPDAAAADRPIRVCASPAYLERRGVPKKPADLVAHDCVVNEGDATSYNWEFSTEGTTQRIQVPCRLAVNLGEAAVAAAADGAGIARVLSYLVDDLAKSRSVVTLLEAYEPSAMPVSLVYPSQRQVPLKLRAFLDFSIPRLRERLSYKDT